MATPKETQPNYPNCLTFKQLEELDVFDDIPHKWLKQKHKDDDMGVELIDLECDKPNWSKTLFKFELSWNGYTQDFNIILEYNDSGFHALKIMDLIIEEEDDGEVEVSDDESEEEEDDRCLRNLQHRVEDEPIGSFTICRQEDLDMFNEDYPRGEFNQLKEELSYEDYLEVFIHKEKEEYDLTMPPYMSDIYLSIGENRRVIYNSYNTSSAFALWLSGQDITYYAEEEEEEEEDTQAIIQPSQ